MIVRKLQRMLDDTNFYQKLMKDPAPSSGRKMNSTLLELKKKKELPESTSDYVVPTNEHPLLYGMPKTLKEGILMRSTVSFVQSPTYILSKHLCHLLSSLVGNFSSAVRNSEQFAEFISDQDIQED